MLEDMISTKRLWDKERLDAEGDVTDYHLHKRAWDHGGHPLYEALKAAGEAVRLQDKVKQQLSDKHEMQSL